MIFQYKNGEVPIIIEKVLCFGLVFFLTPGFYVFHLTLVRPHLVEMYKMGTAKHLFHICLSTFLFINVCGNMFMALFTDTSSKFIKSNLKEGYRYCEMCKKKQPPKSFHCRTCNVCILRRDHHCLFFSRCIGLYNQRYYMMYLTHINVSLIYSTYYDYLFVSSMFDSYDFIISLYKVFNPMLSLITSDPVGVRELYVLFFVFNCIFIVWASGVFWFHVKNIMRGITAYELKTAADADLSKWRENVLSIVGEKWYWAIVWPFADSPLPDISDNVRRC
jgi:palmitoyltransferase